MESQTADIIIIGGGAAGLLAGLRAAETGSRVLVLEKMDRPAKKLAITGKGRGNLTTSLDANKAVAAFGPNGKFLRGAFSRFYNKQLIELLDSIGVPVAEEQGHRIFPERHTAREVADILLRKLQSLGAEVRSGTRVLGLDAEGGAVRGAYTAGGLLTAPRVILCTGGMSYPGTGSTGDGYAFASRAGHSIVEPAPALVPIELDGDTHRELEALSLRLVKVSLFDNGRLIQEELNDLLFTPFGVTGPAALCLGKEAARRQGRQGVELEINFKPGLTADQVHRRLQRDFAECGKKSLKEIMPRLVPRRAAPVILRLAGLPESLTGNQITRAQRMALAEQLTGLRLRVRGARPIEEAIVTSGGVALNEVNPKTMESRLVSGLFICGELLDLDARTGGFNLQAAFTTGWVAGDAAARA
jgi:predicted Rossmann fold flavoprotein